MSREEGVARIESVGARFPDAVRLARVASLAVRIEPHLVRQLRLRLVRDADVGAEADLWFSMLVESRGVDAVVLHRDVAAILRDELSGHPRFDEIVSILVEAHRDAPSTIALEEKVNALAVRDGAAASEHIDRELRAAIVAMRESDARAREIARWFLRAFPRLHPVVQGCSNAIGLLLSASMLLGRRSAGEVAETRGSLASVGWMLPPGALDARIEVGVERLPDALRFTAIEQTANAVPASGGSVGRLSIPRSEPRLVEVAWSHDGTREHRVVEAVPGTTVMLGADATDVRVVTLAGDEYELAASAAGRVETATREEPEPALPPWAADVFVSIQSPDDADAFGTGLVVADRLIVTTAEGVREMGTVGVITPTGRSIQARVLDEGTSGVFTFLGVSSEDRFGTQAQLIRSTTRVRRPNDLPDPPTAILVIARGQLRARAVPNATAAGVVKARDPDGYRFEVVIAERIEPLADFRDAVLVWGDFVAGFALRQRLIPRESQNVLGDDTGVAMEFLSVNAVKESINGALERLERLERALRFRVWISSIPGDLQDYVTILWQHISQHAGLATRLDIADGRLVTSLDQVREAISTQDLFVLVVGDRRVTVKGFGGNLAQFEFEAARRSGIDTLVFLSQDETRVSDRELLVWRGQLKSQQPVQYFGSADEFRMRLDVALTQWREARVRRDPRQRSEPSQEPTTVSDVPPQESEKRRRVPSGRHLARVVMYGQPHSGKTALLRDLTQSGFDPVTRRRGMIWVDGPRTAPDLHAGIVVYEASTDDNWPLALDLEDASVALVVVPFDSGQESATNALVTRVRSIAPGMPIVTVLTRRDREDAAASVLQRLSSEVGGDAPVIQGAIDSSRGPEPIIEELIKQIPWGDRTALGDREWDEAREDERRVFGTAVSDYPVSLRRVTQRPTIGRLGRLAGERALGEFILHSPLTFENVVVAIVSHSRSAVYGLPAVRLREVLVPNLSLPSEIGPADLIEAVAEELASRRVGALSTRTGESVFVLTSRLEATFEPSVPPEARPLLRANWTGTGRDVFIEVLVYYAYTASKNVDAAWQPPLLRGTARVSHDSELYVEVIETGELAELKLSAAERGRGRNTGEIARQLRDALETILSGNASLSFDTPAF